MLEPYGRLVALPMTFQIFFSLLRIQQWFGRDKVFQLDGSHCVILFVLFDVKLTGGQDHSEVSQMIYLSISLLYCFDKVAFDVAVMLQ